MQLGGPPGRRGVPQGVGEQVGQDPLEQARVGEHQREAVRHRHLHPQRVVQPEQGDRRHLVDRRGAQERLQRSGVQAAHVQQVADQGVEPVGVLLDRREQVGLVGLGPLHVGLPQAADAGLDRRQRRAQVVADGREQRGPHPVALGERLGLGGLGAQPFPVQGGGRLGGVAGQQRRRGRVRLPGDQQDQVAADVEAGRGGQAALDAAGGGPHPPAGDPLLQFGLAAVGPGQVLEHGRGRIGTAQDGLRQLEQRGRLFPGPRGLHGAPGREVDHAADRDRDGHEQQQGQQLPGSWMVNVWIGTVKYQFSSTLAATAASTAGQKPPSDRDRHHGDEVDEQVVGDVQVRPEYGQHVRDQRQRGGREQHPGQAPADVDGAVLTGRRGRAGSGAPGARLRHGRTALDPLGPLGPPGGGAAGAHAGIRTHAHQCEPSEVPAEHQAETRAGQRGRADDDGGADGGRPGRPQLRVGRPGEPHRGEPADAGQQDRRDRFGQQRHRPGHRRAGDQHPGRGQAAVQCGGHRPDGQERGEADRQRVRRRHAALRVAESHPLLFQPPDQAISAVLT